MSAINRWLDTNRYQKLAVLVQLVGPILLIGNLIVQGKVLFWGTTYLQFTPWRWLAWQQLSHSELPIWNPLNGMGAPLFANYQSALLYPPNLLLWVGAMLGGISGLALVQTLLVIIHLIGSGIGFVYLTRILGYKPFVQAIAGISYALCTYQVSRISFLSINSVLVWIPWLLYFILGWIQAGSEGKLITGRKSLFLFLLCMSCQLLAGHAQITWYSQILCGLWVLFWTIQYQGWRAVPKRMGVYFVICLIAVGISSVQLLPTFELLQVSQRSAEVGLDYAQNYSFWPWRFLNLISPNLFGNPGLGTYWVSTDNYWENAIYAGMLITIGCVISLFKIRKVSSNPKPYGKLTWFLVGIILISLPMLLGKHTPVFAWLYQNVPTFNLFQAPTRFSIWLVIALILLSATFLDHWQPPTGRKLYWSRLGFAGAIGSIGVSLLAFFSLRSTVNQTYLSGAIETAVLLSILTGLNLFQPSDRTRRKFWKILVVGFILVDLLYVDWMLNPGLKPKVMNEAYYTFPEAGSRIFISAQDEAQIKFERFFRFDNFYPSQGWDKLNQYYLPNNNLYQMQSALNNFDPLVPSKYLVAESLIESLDQGTRDRVLAWLNVSEIEKLSQSTGAVEYINLKPQGRYSWSGCVQRAEDENRAIEMTEEWMEEENLNAYVVLLAKESPPLECNSSNADISVQFESALRQDLHVENVSPGWLIQKDIWYPGWSVVVDGQKEPLIPANYFLRGVFLDPGSHLVTIEYKPVSLSIGAGISFISLVSLMIIVLLNRRGQDDRE